MLLETQQLQDTVLQARCRMAVTANRLVRLDNPIAAAQLAAMQVGSCHASQRCGCQKSQLEHRFLCISTQPRAGTT
jgi:hypothetical protein